MGAKNSFLMRSSENLKMSIPLAFILPFVLSCANNPIRQAPENLVSDIDGNVYTTIKLGNQIWTVENLRTTKYNDGTPIELDTSATTWSNANATIAKYCFYNNTSNPDTIMKFGALYNWYAIDTKKLAPSGWHVPTDADWDTLQNYLIANGFNYDGTTTGNKIAKSMAAKTDWSKSLVVGTIGDTLATNNRSGFSALPGGYRTYSSGVFDNIGNYCYLWSATESNSAIANVRALDFGKSSLLFQTQVKNSGFSVRLIKD
jgi:uncharacterized protein (TIGR02145 family)